MKAPIPFALLIVAPFAAACGTPETPTNKEGAWVGTVETEGDITTVVNESGSVWSGTATLVEELSIGLDRGPEEYMLGDVGSVYMVNDRIYVADGEFEVVRIYDLAGRFVAELGGKGEGPGEYQFPSLVAASPDGTAFVYDSDRRRINAYSSDGEPLDTWTVRFRGWTGVRPQCCAWKMVGSSDGRLWMPVYKPRVINSGGVEVRTSDGSTSGAASLGPEGSTGSVVWVPEIDYQRVEYTAGRDPTGAPDANTVPYSPKVHWGVTFTGGIAAGASDEYRYEVHQRDGTVLEVERYWDPVPVSPGEAQWLRRVVISNVRTHIEPGWQGSVTIPETKPAFFLIIPAATGEVWVVREGSSRRVEDCVEDPLETDPRTALRNRCWRPDLVWDVFGRDGRYLGEAEVPADVQADQLKFFARGDTVVAATQDPAGTIRLKRYRLVLPTEDSQ